MAEQNSKINCSGDDVTTYRNKVDDNKFTTNNVLVQQLSTSAQEPEPLPVPTHAHEESQEGSAPICSPWVESFQSVLHALDKLDISSVFGAGTAAIRHITAAKIAAVYISDVK